MSDLHGGNSCDDCHLHLWECECWVKEKAEHQRRLAREPKCDKCGDILTDGRCVLCANTTAFWAG